MRVLRNLFIGLAACFELAAIVSFIVNFNRIDSTTSTFALTGWGLALVGLVLAMLVRRSDS